MTFAVKLLTIELALLLVGQQVYSRKIYAYFDTLACPYSSDSNYVEILKCWFVTDQDGQLLMNAELKLKQNLTNINLKFMLVVEQSNKNITYVSVDIDICDALGAAMTNPILRLMADEIRRKGNLPLACPLKKGIVYGFYNFEINSKLIPPFAPRLRWIADSNYYTKTSTTTEKLMHVIAGGRVDHVKPKAVTTA